MQLRVISPKSGINKLLAVVKKVEFWRLGLKVCAAQAHTIFRQYKSLWLRVNAIRLLDAIPARFF
jgi:hypothetical protein